MSRYKKTVWGSSLLNRIEEGIWRASEAAAGYEGWYDVVTDLGLVGDNATDNSPLLRAAIRDVPIAAPNAAVTWIWPQGQYVFKSSVVWPKASIRNVGLGSGAWDDQRYMTSIKAGANNMTIFDLDGGDAGSSFQGPRFENFAFTGNLKTGVSAIKMQRITRCGLHNVMFYLMDVGLEFNQNAVDCAWHDLQMLTFNACKTGLLSRSSNSWDLYGFNAQNCGAAFDFSGITVNTQIWGGKINSPIASNAIWSGGAKVGYRIGATSYANAMYGTAFELGDVAASGRIAIDIAGDSNLIDGVVLNGGSGAGNTNEGIHIRSGANLNEISWRYHTFSDINKVFIIEPGAIKNKVRGFWHGLAADRVSAQHHPGAVWMSTDTGVPSISDGSHWINLVTS